MLKILFNSAMTRQKFNFQSLGQVSQKHDLECEPSNHSFADSMRGNQKVWLNQLK